MLHSSIGVTLTTIDSSVCTSARDDRSSTSITCGDGGPNYVVTGGTARKADTSGELTFISISRLF